MRTFGQTQFRARLRWGRRGARAAAAAGDVIVVVDTLSFSSAVATAAARGAVVYPCGPDDDAAALAAEVGAEVAVRREDAPRAGRFSLSPLSFLAADPGTRVVLPSPNGATCVGCARAARLLLVGAPLNAAAVAAAAAEAAGADGAVTVLACGERWAGDRGDLRVAVEDYLGAGAVLDRLPLARSPEADTCAGAFRHARKRLADLFRDCGSGQELRERGYASDVRHAARLDRYDVAPALRGRALTPPPAPP